MFKGPYYKNKYVHTSADGMHTLYESNVTFDGIEFFMYIPISSDDYVVFLKDAKHFLSLKDSIVSLKEFLIANGYTQNDFINPFNRTKKIVNEITNINQLNKPKIKRK